MPGRFKSKPAFCACIARGLKPREAARAIGVTRATVYNWKRDDPEFREMWEAALNERIEEAESQLFKLVQAGSFPAIAYALKHWCPEKYDRAHRVALSGDGGMPKIGVEHSGEVIHFFMPPNRRDVPEVLDDEQPPAIEGEATEAA
jgi:hypothetical protein